jgi:hypothetical protein
MNQDIREQNLDQAKLAAKAEWQRPQLRRLEASEAEATAGPGGDTYSIS